MGGLLLVVGLLLGTSSTMVGPTVATQTSIPAGPDFYTYLLAPLPTASQCANAASTTSNQGDTITCTRASTAYCTKDNGTIVSHANNRCRVESRGLVREPAGTNIALRSNEINDGTWSVFSASLGGTNVGVFADGTTSMEQLISDNGNGIAYQLLTVSSSVGPFTASGYFSKSSTGFASVAMFCGTSAVATCTCEREDGAACTAEKNGEGAVSLPGLCLAYSTFGTTAKRLSVTMTCASAETDLSVSLSGGQRHSGGVETYGGTAYVGGVQVELGPVATSYVATAGTSATRAAETITTTLPTVIDTGGCIGATVTYSNYPGASAIFATDTLDLETTSATGLTLTDGSHTATATVASLANTATPIRAFFTGSALSVAALGTAASSAWSGHATSDNVVTLGGGAFAGHFSALRANSSPYGCRP